MYYKITKIMLASLFLSLGISSVKAQVVQKIGDKPFIVSPSAVFELESKTKGFLPPRMSTLERDAIVSPATGLTIYNSTSNSLEVNEGTTLVPAWNSVKAFLPLAGGIMTGDIKGLNLTLNNNAATNSTTIGGGTTTGDITLGGTAAQSINIGTGAGVKTVTLGSSNSSSSTSIQSGTGALSLTPGTTGVTLIGNSAGTGTITLGSSNTTQTVNIGTGTGSSTVNIATASGNNFVLIGGSLGASGTSIQSGSGGLQLNPGNTGTTLIGSSMGQGTITLGSSSSAQTVNIGTGNGASSVNIATSSVVANSITIGGTKSLIAVGTAPLEASAAFAVNSTTKGFLPPRMTTVDRNAIVTPAAGLTIYNTSTSALEINAGTPAIPIWKGIGFSGIIYPSISNRLTDDYTLLEGDSTVLFDATAKNLTATLPSAASYKGKIYYVRKDDDSTNTLTISPSVMIAGTSVVVAVNYAKTIKVQSNGSDWVVID